LEDEALTRGAAIAFYTVTSLVSSLVAALGFLLLASLVISTILTALSDYIDALLPSGHQILLALNFIASFVLITILFAAIYKVLPDEPIEWRDVLVGAIATALLFTAGKFLIGLYLAAARSHRATARLAG
jgi:membrane protein